MLGKFAHIALDFTPSSHLHNANLHAVLRHIFSLAEVVLLHIFFLEEAVLLLFTSTVELPLQVTTVVNHLVKPTPNRLRNLGVHFWILYPWDRFPPIWPAANSFLLWSNRARPLYIYLIFVPPDLVSDLVSLTSVPHRLYLFESADLFTSDRLIPFGQFDHVATDFCLINFFSRSAKSLHCVSDLKQAHPSCFKCLSWQLSSL